MMDAMRYGKKKETKETRDCLVGSSRDVIDAQVVYQMNHGFILIRPRWPDPLDH